ncbi:MAG: RidA family protein [Pseudomonadota bacterium]
MIRALIPPDMDGAPEALGASPGILSGSHVFLTGMTGSRADGSMPSDIDTQGHNAMAKIGRILAEVDLTHAAIIEMTTYHIDIQSHFEAFNQVRRSYVSDPFPAWTAVEVAALRRPGALVEIRVIAALAPS